MSSYLLDFQSQQHPFLVVILNVFPAKDMARKEIALTTYSSSKMPRQDKTMQDYRRHDETRLD
jgi:hypothetical protein